MIPTLPRNIGVIHFIGIGGIGMSGIAEVLHNLGYKVQGSDIADSANVKRLTQQGIKVLIGHKADNLGAAEVVVTSSAVKPDNPEVVAARAKLIPVVRRAEMLAELMRLKWSVAVGGTHGKTTTTSLVAALMESAGYDPTVINGGIINSYGTNMRLGAGDWMVVEADESDGTFVKLPSTITVVTNMDPEHMDHYHTFDAMRRAYDQFVSNIPFYGFAVLCVDHPEVQTMIGRLSDRKIVTYGFSKQADVRATNVRIAPGIIKFDVAIKSRRGGPASTMRDVELSMVGEHNVQNSLAAVAIAWELGIDEKKLRDALAGFRGVKRRFTKTGEWNGISIIDDYGHHPVEIATTLKAARTATKGKVIAVVQPHRYSRLRDLFEQFCTAFNDADKVVVADVYAAGEAPVEGISGDALINGLKSRGHRNVKKLGKPEELAALIADIASPGDLVVCLGAGSITQWANALPEQMRAAAPSKPEGKK